jgi:4-amino-4-deoxy-L-arabinose transferase-like glycosyltransferase
MTVSGKTLGLIALILLFCFVLRLPYFIHTLQDIDEGCHAAIATILMDGGLPYANTVDSKPPGILYIYLITFVLFGKYNMVAVHMVAFLCTLATAIILSLLAKKLAGESAALCALLFYLAFTTALYPKMIAANTEIFMALPYSLAVLLLWYSFVQEKRSFIFISGFIAGLAPLLKQVGGVEILAVFLYLLLALPLLYGKKRIGSSLLTFGLFSIGFVLPMSAVAFLFYREGILADLVFWTITFPRRYISTGTENLSFISQIVAEFIPFVLSTIILWVLSCIWIKRAVVDLRDQKRSFSSRFSLFLLLWFVTSASATFIGNRMYGHYFIQILPSLSLMAAVIAGKYFEQGATNGKFWKPAILALTAIPALVFMGMAISYEATTDTWGKAKPDFRPATEYIKTHTNPKDKIFVWGWFTPVYVYSERTPSTRFIATTLQTGYRQGNDPNEGDRGDIAWVSVPETWPMLMKDLNRSMPEMIIDTSPGNYHDFGRYPIRDYPLLSSFVEKNCRMETSIAGMDIYRCGTGSSPSSAANAVRPYLRY